MGDMVPHWEHRTRRYLQTSRKDAAGSAGWRVRARIQCQTQTLKDPQRAGGSHEGVSTCRAPHPCGTRFGRPTTLMGRKMGTKTSPKLTKTKPENASRKRPPKKQPGPPMQEPPADKASGDPWAQSARGRWSTSVFARVLVSLTCTSPNLHLSYRAIRLVFLLIVFLQAIFPKESC